MTDFRIDRPREDEYPPYFGKYIELVAGNDAMGVLRGQIAHSLETLRAVSGEGSLRRYAESKWSLREVVGHMIDTERIMAYRALRAARADATPLSSFDQDAYIAAAGFDLRDWAGLLEEFDAVRRTTVMLFAGLDAAAWGRRGVAGGKEITPRALAFIIAGHESHHMRIVRERYL